jgi:toxin ParE1/3/4
MKSIAVAPEAECDLSDIRRYTIKQWNLAQAETYLSGMGKTFAEIASGSKISRAVGRDGFRKVSYGSHMIYFLETLEAITIARILHVRMDAEKHLA